MSIAAVQVSTQTPTPRLLVQVVEERDWMEEMRLIIKLKANGEASAPIAAKEIVDALLKNDPELLQNWLLLGAPGFIRDAINAVSKSERGRNRSIAGRNPEVRAVFRNTVQEGDASDLRNLGDNLSDEVVTSFLHERYVVAGNRRMSLGDMGREERLFVAHHYRQAAKEHALREAFIRAVDRRAGLKRTAEVFSEESLAKLWHSLDGSS